MRLDTTRTRRLRSHNWPAHEPGRCGHCPGTHGLYLGAAMWAKDLADGQCALGTVQALFHASVISSPFK